MRKSAYEMRISYWSSYVCSSDLGQRDLGRAILRQQRAEHQPRGVHGLDQFVGRDVAAPGARVDLQVGAVLDDAPGAQLGQQAPRGLDVVQIGSAPCRERVYQYGTITGTAGSHKTKIRNSQ